jgi:hypothetical protein
MVLHTADGCSVAGSGQSGTLSSDICDVSYSTSGCGVTPNVSATYGTAFNNANGGVFAVEWTSAAIKMWFFQRGSIPPSISLGLPDTSEFKTPQANFAGSCDIDTHFYNHTFIFDTTFCGDWAGNAYRKFFKLQNSPIVNTMLTPPIRIFWLSYGNWEG